MAHEKELMEKPTELRAKVQAPCQPEDPEQVREHLGAAAAMPFFEVDDEANRQTVDVNDYMN